MPPWLKVPPPLDPVARTAFQNSRFPLLFQNLIFRFLLQLRELARYRAAEAIFRIAGGGESGWDAVEQFLPDSDKHSLFHAWLMKGLTNANLFPTVTMWDIINWEKKKRIIEQ